MPCNDMAVKSCGPVRPPRPRKIDAYQRDLDVLIAGECVYSYDPEHHEITRRYLDDHIAPFRTNQEIVELLSVAARQVAQDR